VSGHTRWDALRHKSSGEQVAHEREVAELVELGMTRVQAERHLAAVAGENISDLEIELADPHRPQ
jgi:hypothetical protein